MRWRRQRTTAEASHLRGLARASAYVALLGLTLGALQVRSAHAEVKSQALEIGRQMLQLARASQHDVNKLSLNGQRLWLGTSLTSSDVAEVLDRYAESCATNAAQGPSSWRDLAVASRLASPSKTGLSAGTGTLRAGDSAEGIVVCFTKNDHSLPGLREALTTFAQTGELGALGNLRYVYAKRSESAETVVLTAWTDDAFNLAEIVPAEGTEAHGADFTEFPRPPHARLRLSARVEDSPFGINVYRSHQRPQAIVAFYDAAMAERGWFAVDPEPHLHASKGAPECARLYERNGVVLTVASSAHDGSTLTGLGLAGVTPKGSPTAVERPLRED